MSDIVIRPVVQDVPKVQEPPKAEAPKVKELPKVEVPKVEAPKVEEAKAEPPKVEVPKAETPKVEEAPKVEEIKTPVLLKVTKASLTYQRALKARTQFVDKALEIAHALLEQMADMGMLKMPLTESQLFPGRIVAVSNSLIDEVIAALSKDGVEYSITCTGITKEGTKEFVVSLGE